MSGARKPTARDFSNYRVAGAGVGLWGCGGGGAASCYAIINGPTSTYTYAVGPVERRDSSDDPVFLGALAAAARQFSRQATSYDFSVLRESLLVTELSAPG
jgi:hypothetical protein